tara:strand:- start:124 stop:351 length:228 start_codon:yes stop_codon:yes gene_type:complete
MIYDLFKVWPSCIVCCFIGGVYYHSVFWFLGFVWIIIGLISFSSNGKKHLIETLQKNLLFWAAIVVLIGCSHLFS